jgi:broad specificity phosphatase PhoE
MCHWSTAALAGAAFGFAAAALAFRSASNDCRRAHEVDRRNRAREIQLRNGRRSVRVWFIRHAQSESNRTKDNCHNGRHVNVALSDLGRKQAQALGRRLAAEGVKFDEVYSSEAIRAQQTAALTCAQISAPPPLQVITTRQPDTQLPAMGVCEIAMGAWTGSDKAVCNTAAVLRAREDDAWDWRPPGLSADESLPGESYHEVEDRVLAFLDEIVLPKCNIFATADKQGDEKHVPIIAIFSHHAAIRCALRGLLEASPRMLGPKLSPQNTSITELTYESGKSGRKGGWSLVRVNDYSHLQHFMPKLGEGGFV